ncbi:FMN-binding glutamate synthase family protein [Desulfothermobacter acidiphilus]|uniref:FMN-binding glutamate synthase family protein n=1 Tax=Desulfothermobacter acidiphilus TaxID=1938353 RepID=UPI003F8AED58
MDYSHFTILGTVTLPHGIEPDPERMIFPNVDLTTELGANGGIKLRLPIVVAAMGSTAIAANNWDHLAAGAALAGVGIVVGENVCAMDPKAEIKNGRIQRSPAMERRIRAYRDWQRGPGFIAVQANVEDTRLGVQEYCLERLGVTAVELKWGQGAKSIGGEVKLDSLDRALELKRRGYIVLPDPEDPTVQEAYHALAFREFERHSRVGVVDEEAFLRRVEELRRAGAKYITLKTGAYRPADLARAVRLASLARLDLLTVDGAGGGTGMSPWRMMNEWGVPTLYLQGLLNRFLDRLAAKERYLPPVAIAGGLSLEDHIFKALAIGAPYVKAVGMARAPLTAAMVGKTVGISLQEGRIFPEYEKYGDRVEQVFISATELKHLLGTEEFQRLPLGAIGVYTYFERLAQGLRQLMCGARKFGLRHLTRDDVAALTPEAAAVTGIKYLMDVDAEEAERLLDW